MNKFLRVDMSKLTTDIRETGNEYEFSGGRGLIARLLNEEVDPCCDPFGLENKLILCTGILAGTLAPTSGRLSIGTKSPLTGGIKEANAGGIFGKRMNELGIKAVIIEGKPQKDELYILKVNEKGVFIISAEKYRGLNNYKFCEELMKDYPKDTAVASIGCAGERRYKNSSIQITDTEGRPSRAAARGGVGAVMGAKGLKAVILEKPNNKVTIRYSDFNEFKKANKGYIEGIKNNGTSGLAMPNFGTAVLVNAVNALGALPVRNFSSGSFDSVESISGEELSRIQKLRGGSNGHACQPGCPIKCSNIYKDEKGQYLTSGFEYETIALNGSNLGISNLDLIAKIDRLCDDLGVDTMETGCTLGVCMDAGVIDFGDEDGVLSLIDEMINDTDFGKVIAGGAAECGKYLGVSRIPVVKNQGLAAYDPRALKGTGVTYATTPMGADHTAGNTIGDPSVSPYEKEGQVSLSTDTQVGMATFDSLGMCIFSGFCTAEPGNIEHLLSMLQSRFGGVWGTDRLFGLGIETISLEKKFNKAAGFTAEDDRLPDFMYKEPLAPNNTVFDITDEEMSAAIPF